MKLRDLMTYLYYLLVFFVPLTFLPFTREIFEMPKMFLVYIVGTLIFCVYFVSKFPKNKVENKVLVVPGLFIALHLLSALINGLDYNQLFGYYGRFSGGLISLVYYFGLFYIALRIFDRNQFQKLLNIALLSYLLVLFCAFLQKIGLFGSVPDRVFGTFGQPNWLGSFIVLFLPLVVHKYVFTKSIERYIWLFTAMLGVLVLWFTFSISSFVALFIAVLSYLVFNRKLLGKNLYFIGSTFLGLLMFLLIFFPGLFVSKLYDGYNSLFDTSSVYKVSDPGVIRLNVWRGTWQMITDNPKNFLVGIGSENFAYEFSKFRSPNLNYSSEWSFIINKPHNYFLELWAEGGIITLVTYLFFVRLVLKNLPVELGAGLVGLLVALFFGFPIVAVELWFWLLSASAFIIKAET